MALVLADRVQQTGTANTTVSFTLSGSVTGFQSFAVVGNTNTTYYSAFDASGNWEVGIGTYATGGTLTRTTILSSSNSGSAVTFSGTVNVILTYPSSKSVNLDASGNATSLGTPAAFVGTNITGTASGLSIGGNAATATSATSSTTQSKSNVSTSIATTAFAKNLHVAPTTAGTLNWNDSTNTYPGVGDTLLLGSATNGPGGGNYYFPFNFEYSSNDGSGNVTQLGVPYGSSANTLWMRGRYSGTWSSWVQFLSSSNYNSYSPTLTGGGASGTWGISISGNAATASNTNSISSAVGNNYTWTGVQYFLSNGNTASISSPPLEAYSNNGSGAIMAFHRGGYYAVNMGLDSDNVFRIGGWSAPANLFTLDMAGNGYTSATMGSGRLFTGYDSGQGGSVSCNNWFRTSGANGIYYASYGRGMNPVDGVASYGNNCVYGSGLNGWQGWSVNTSNNCILMSNAGTHGLYSPASGIWLMQMDTSGNTTFNGNVTAYSDIRLKDNIREIDNPIERRNTLAKAAIKYERDGKTRIGYGAQYLREGSCGEFVHEAEDDAYKLATGTGTLSVDYGETAAVLAVTSKMTDDKVASLEARIAQLEKIIEGLTK